MRRSTTTRASFGADVRCGRDRQDCLVPGLRIGCTRTSRQRWRSGRVVRRELAASIGQAWAREGQVTMTPMIHAVVASRTEASSRSIETPTARNAALVDGQADRGPTRWNSDA